MVAQENKNNIVGAAAVVGGGVAGIQAALDLANSGIKVYLIEAESAIGGKMSQLDKTFPTNDCAMCTVSPRLVECSRHRNIEIITNADVTDLKGTAGDFKLSIRKRPRYVREDKCTGCGDCAAKCPIKLPAEYDEAMGTRTAIHRRYAQAVPSTFVIDKKGRAPCKAACPAECGTQGYIALTAAGRYQEGIDLVHQTIPFASVCGRVCPAFCEKQCRREQVDQPIAIASLKRFLADWEFKQGPKAITVLPRTKDQNVAIIGAGPAGLTAAGDLVRKGYGVTVFEALPVAGGMLKVGIPAFRLSHEQLQSEIDAIIGLGVDLKLATRVDDIDSLLKDKYSAVFLATGAHTGKKLNISGKDLPQSYGGVEFLRRIALGENVKIGANVLVIGGGNVAMDCVRSSRRIGFDDVKLLYRRTEAEMPADPVEIAEAKAQIGQEVEGVVTSQSVHALAQGMGIEMPISEEVYRVLFAGVSPLQATASLLDREPKPELV
jgi:NADPH-dependent glutamate synthase beta subunit-like oxidoreductase/NAD-dependent dihydropyrimidine dehydrogenase PreA subunit